MSVTTAARTIRVADLFCGAGGSSLGARRALERHGCRMKLVAVNHWDVALTTHARNFPDDTHVLDSMWRVDPREVVPGGRLDLLLASPTCTFHSRARGGRPISREQRYGRMTPMAVVRWLTDLDVPIMIVENVPEFVDWTSVHRKTWRAEPGSRCARAHCSPEKYCRARKGMYFRAWVRKIERLGYRCEWRVLCAADYGDATTRRRFFMIARKDGTPITWPAPTHARRGQGDLFTARVRPWRPARDIIDWALPGRSIFTRKKPLSPKTLARIHAGAERFAWPEAFLVVLRRHMDGKSLDEPLPTICALGNHLGLAQVRSFVLPQHGGGVAREVADPLPTVATDGAHALLTAYHGNGRTRPVTEPMPTQTTRDRFGLVVPVTHRDSSNRARSLDDPLPTITGAHRGELAFIVGAFGERRGQAPRVHSVDEPAPTICAKGRIQLARGAVAKDETAIYLDILFRMLQPHELAAAMGFSDAEVAYVFVGTKTQVTAMIGNAVPVQTAAALVGAVFA